ncbi:MAG: Butyryl-CoA dehydrogenase [Polaromonas sp.]|jgi:alkylation response protein AidB-like acyl-CoA dehydrogenase|nr:Butyryl-CoA dehydrogenase [Polaromonas sp.]MDB5938834.1 Butyryl-CoA dehydrogenase [Polaromonas sp.]
MDYSYRIGVTDEDQTLADAVGRFAQAELAPRASERDATEGSVTCHVKALAELGVMGMNIPERWGGPGVSPMGMLLALVEISRACAATSSMIGAHYLGTDAVLIGGDDAQRDTWLPRAASGEWLAGFALTEPLGGSNPVDMRTRAVRDGDSYRINGVKHFISNAAEAHFLVVFAKTDPEAGARGVSAFVVNMRTPGLLVSSHEKLMGIRGAHAFEVSFDQLSVPLSCRLGEEGSGFKTAMKVLDNSRLDVAATSLGLAQAALDAAVQWARDRKTGGEPLAHRQGIQWMLADMKLRMEASWALTLQATALRTAGRNFTQQSAMAKLHASEMVGFVTDAALQIHGGYGFTREMPLERYVRDARILRIYEGSSEIQRTIIARGLLG